MCIYFSYYIYLLFHMFYHPENWHCLSISLPMMMIGKCFGSSAQSKHYSIFLYSSILQLKQILEFEIESESTRDNERQRERERERRGDNTSIERWHSRISFGFVLKKNVDTRGNESPFFRAILFFFCFSSYLQSVEPYSTYHSWTYIPGCHSNMIPFTG